MTAEFREITLEVQDRVAVLTLNRPDLRNIISHEAIIAEFERACAEVNGNPDVSVLLLTGAGSVFSAGGNVKDMAERAAGLVLKVVPADRLMPTALELAREIAAKPPHALRLAKMLYRQGLRATNLRDFLETCAAFQALCHHTADHLEAVKALLERRNG